MDDDRRELTPRRRQHWRVDADTDEAALDVKPARLNDRLEAKQLLWRDSATILVGVVVALLAVQLFLRFAPATAPSSPSPFASELVIGPQGSSGSSSGPGFTLGPVVDPSLGIDVRRTRRPEPTLPPTGTQPPTPGATPRPTRAPTAPPTPPPTAPSTAPPTPALPSPTPTPTPTPEITPPPPPPAPAADFTWSQDGITTIVNFSDGSSGMIDTWSWDFGDGNSSSQASPSHDYGTIGVFQVTFTVTGPGGSDTIMKTVTVV